MVLAGAVISMSITASSGSWCQLLTKQSHTLLKTDTTEQTLSYLDAMKGVMSSSRGKDTYVVIFRLSLAECSNRYRNENEREEE